MVKAVLVIALAISLIQITLCLQLVVTTSETPALKNSWDVPPPVGACSAQSSVFTVEPSPRTNNMSQSRVLAASVPSSGSTWVRLLLEEASGEPTCAVYSGEGCLIERLGAYCRKGTSDQCDLPATAADAFYVKTHWPLEVSGPSPFYVKPNWMFETGNIGFTGIASDTVSASDIVSAVEKLRSGYDGDNNMHFSKLLMVVRHPLVQMASFSTRWGRTITLDDAFGIADAVYCWSAWWARVLNELPGDNVHVVRYEDVCKEPDEQMDSLLKFFGYHRAVAGHSSSLDCSEKRTVELATQQFESVQPGLAAKLTERLQPVMKLWGYA